MTLTVGRVAETWEMNQWQFDSKFWINSLWC